MGILAFAVVNSSFIGVAQTITVLVLLAKCNASLAEIKKF